MKLLLAPMADITDMTFRELCYKAGADICYSEMISVKGLHYESEKTFKMTELGKNETKTFIQLFGVDAHFYDEAVRIIDQKRQPYGFDINMGCPVKKVIKTGAGSAMMNNPENVRSVIAAVRKATDKKVSVKIRKGFDRHNAFEIARITEGEGADILVIHPRTRKEMFSGDSDYELSMELADKLSIPVVHSGDIAAIEDVDKFQDTNLYGLMIGRGILGKPWLFKEIKEQRTLNNEEKNSFISLHLRKIIKRYAGHYKVVMLRKHAIWYSKGYRGSAEFRRNLYETCKDIEEVIALIESFFNMSIT